MWPGFTTVCASYQQGILLSAVMEQLGWQVVASLSNEGRVEICQSGEWKTICDNNWGENEARVVCRQLGHTTQGMVIQY